MTSVAVIMRFSIQLFSMLFTFLKLASHNFKWFLEFLTYYPFYSLRLHQHQHNHHHHQHQPLQEFQMVTEERVERWHNPREGGGGGVECTVCLSKIGEGEEVRILRCEHVFHRDCLNQWVGHRNYTCPLCRDFLGSGIIRSVVHDVGGRRHV